MTWQNLLKQTESYKESQAKLPLPSGYESFMSPEEAKENQAKLNRQKQEDAKKAYGIHGRSGDYGMEQAVREMVMQMNELEHDIDDVPDERRGAVKQAFEAASKALENLRMVMG
jgi:hypothetical protein